MELKITELFNAICPSDFSASVAEIGQNAGADTWRAAREEAPDYLDLLAPPGACEALIAYLSAMGYSEAGELQALDIEQLTALLIQLVSGDMREFIGFGETGESWDWDAYENGENAGGHLFRGTDGEIYYYLGV